MQPWISGQLQRTRETHLSEHLLPYNKGAKYALNQFMEIFQPYEDKDIPLDERSKVAKKLEDIPRIFNELNDQTMA